MQPIIISNFSRRNEFIKMLAERGAKSGVEVGTDHGNYAYQLLEGIPNLFLVCVDPWAAYTEGEQAHTQEEMDEMYKSVITNLTKYMPEHRLQIRRETSMEAVSQYDDEYFDFVFIDGNHDYEHVLQDISHWAQKVKPGGVICGHDYKIDPVNNYGVIGAVTKYVEDNHIAPLFILQKKGLVDCWMFIKQ